MLQGISSFMTALKHQTHSNWLKTLLQLSLSPVSHEPDKEHHSSREGTCRKTLWIVCFQSLLSVCLQQENRQSWLLTAGLMKKTWKGSISGIEKFRTWPLYSLQGRYGGERKFLRVKEDWNHKWSMHLSCTLVGISVHIYEWRRKRLKVYEWMALSEVWCGVIKDACIKWSQWMLGAVKNETRCIVGIVCEYTLESCTKYAVK